MTADLLDDLLDGVPDVPGAEELARRRAAWPDMSRVCRVCGRRAVDLETGRCDCGAAKAPPDAASTGAPGNAIELHDGDDDPRHQVVTTRVTRTTATRVNRGFGPRESGSSQPSARNHSARQRVPHPQPSRRTA